MRVYVPRRLVTTISVHASSPISTTQLSRHVVSNGVLVWHTPSHSLSDSAACASFFGDKLDISNNNVIIFFYIFIYYYYYYYYYYSTNDVAEHRSNKK